MFFRKFFLFLCLAFASLITNAATPMANPADIEDVKKILHITKFDKAIRRDLLGVYSKPDFEFPESNVDVDIFLAPFTVEAINERMAPIYVNYLSNDYAKKLLTELNAPRNKNFLRISHLEIDVNWPAANQAFQRMATNERKEILQFQNSTTIKSLLNAKENAKNEVSAQIRYWVAEHRKTVIAAARGNFVTYLEKELNADKNDVQNDSNINQIKILRTGIVAVDTELRISFDFLKRLDKINKKFDQDLEKLNLGKILEPEQLASHEKMEESNIIVLAAENLFDDELRTSKKIFEEHFEKLGTIPLSPNARKALMDRAQKDISELFAIRQKFIENLHNLFNAKKQLLIFFEKNFGNYRSDNNNWIFANQQLVDEYSTLMTLHNNSAEELKKIQDQDFQRREKTLNRVRNAK